MAKVRANIYRISGNTVYIDCFGIKGHLTGTILIDKEDLEKVSVYKWHIEHSRKTVDYAQISLPGKTLRLHRLIMQTDLQIDHINHNGLDNRKCNLRICTNQENNFNKNHNRNPKSGYTGIRYNEKADSYYVRIMVNKKEISLGHYKTLEEALLARKNGELTYFGEFTYKNS